MKKLIFAVFFCVLGIGSAFAQKTFSGKVTEANGLGLPGVNVVLKTDKTVGAATDIDGKWTLAVPNENSILVFTAIGMKPVELAAKDANTLVMKPDAEVLDEVMVVAYGTANRKTFTGSAAKVDGDKLEMKNTSEVTKALQGEVAGVQVIGSGAPGKNATVRIRGYGSVNASRAPLYVVDGVPYDGDISSINPSDIESSTVLKDASSAALYGARGANGVILITTKKGKRGKSEVEVNLKTGVNMRLLPMYDVVESPERYMELIWEGLNNNRTTLANNIKTNHGVTIAEADLANAALFNNTYGYGINSAYNMWNAAGDKLIDPTTGKFLSGVTRKYTPEKWYDNIFDPKGMYELGVKFSGAGEKSNHYTSLSFRDDKGFYIKSGFKRLNVRSNLSQQVKSWMKTSLNMSYSYMEYSQPGQGSNMNNGFAYVNGMPYMFPVFKRDKDGNKIKDTRLGGYRYDYGQNALGQNIRQFGGGINPAGALQLDVHKTEAHQIEASPSMDITLSDDLKFSTKLGVQYLMSDNNRMTNLFYGDGAGLGYLYRIHGQTLSYTWNQILNWSHSYNDVHNLSAFVGHEVNAYKYKYMYGSMKKLVDPFNTELNNGVIRAGLNSYTSKYSLESYIAQVKYDFEERYFIQLNYRRDGTSRFPNGKWGNFGSVGLAWLLNRESFMEDVSWLKELKLKASYGILGNQSLLSASGQPMYYPTYDTYGINNLNDQISLVTGYKGNRDLTWESSKTLNLGVEFNISDIVEGGLEYFNKNTDDLLFQRDVPRSFGYAKLPVNSGKLNNSGIELELLAHVVNTNDLKINFNLNASRYTNELTEMPVQADGSRVNLEQHTPFAYQKGRSIYDFYIPEWAGVNPQTGSPQWTIYYDEVGGKKVPIANLEQYKKANGGVTKLVKETTEVYDEATWFYQDKSVLPEIMGGFGFDISWKGLKLAAQFGYSIGGYAYDGTYAGLMHNKSQGAKNWHKDMENSWKKPGDVTDVPKIISFSTNTNDDKVNYRSSRFLTDKSYLNLSSLNLSYSFPTAILNKIKLNELTLFASGDNLFMLSKRQGFNPLVYEDGGSSDYAYSPLSSISFGLRVKF